MKVTQLEPFGALVEDVDLSARRSAQQSAELLKAFNENYLLIARGQNLSDEDHLRIFDDLFPGENLADEGGTGSIISYVSNVRPDGFFGDGPLSFHSDFSFTTDPTRLISLYGTDVEPGSSPTEFASGERALLTLPADLRAYLADKQVVSATDLFTADTKMPLYSLPGREDLSGIPYETIVRTAWPIVMDHPRTGRPLIYANELHAHHLHHVPLAEGRAVLERLFAHLYAPDNIYTHEWRNGDFVLWDNIGLAHGRRATKIGQAKRSLRRVRGGGATLPMMTQLSQRGLDDPAGDAETTSSIEIKRALGTRLRALRLARGLTHQALSATCGIGYSRISAFETANWLPTEDEIARLAKSLAVAPDELTGGLAMSPG